VDQQLFSVKRGYRIGAFDSVDFGSADFQFNSIQIVASMQNVRQIRQGRHFVLRVRDYPPDFDAGAYAIFQYILNNGGFGNGFNHYASRLQSGSKSRTICRNIAKAAEVLPTGYASGINAISKQGIFRFFQQTR
jgi:hypothetical protein